jgi:hypothetical protein
MIQKKYSISDINYYDKLLEDKEDSPHTKEKYEMKQYVKNMLNTDYMKRLLSSCIYEEGIENYNITMY